MGSVALAQGQPSPALAPLQPKVPQQPNLPTGPKSIPPSTGPAPDLVFVRQSMIDNIQRRPIIVKNVGDAPSVATTVGCQGGGELPPPEKVFAFIDGFHAVKALAPGETYEHLGAPSTAPITSYDCSIRQPLAERVTSNNTFKWSAAQSNSLAAWAGAATREPLQKVVIPRPDLALESITVVETHKTVFDDYKLSFRVHAKNLGNVDIAGASITCDAAVPVPSGASLASLATQNQRIEPNTQLSKVGDGHVVPFDVRIAGLYILGWRTNDVGTITCNLKFNATSNDTVVGNNQISAPWYHPNARALNFPLLSR
jgi:hypothetical protein